MPGATRSAVKRPCISIEFSHIMRRHLRHVAAKRHLSVREYVLRAIETRIEADLADEHEALAALSGASDPVLAELWDNDEDAAYDNQAKPVTE